MNRAPKRLLSLSSELDIAVTTMALLAWYHIIKEFLPSYQQGKEKYSFSIWKEKRLSWIMTLLSAIFASVMTVIYAVDLTIYPTTLSMPFELKDLVDLDTYTFNTPNMMKFLFGHDRLSLLSIRFFCTYMVLDTIYMYRYYYNISNAVSWIHHIGYAIVMASTLFFTPPCPMIFVVFFPLEISTIFLAVGNIWPYAKQDILFGVTFFMFRVVYHGALVAYLFYNFTSIPPYKSFYAIGASMSWFMHCHWFVNWFKKFVTNRFSHNRVKEL